MRAPEGIQEIYLVEEKQSHLDLEEEDLTDFAKVKRDLFIFLSIAG